MSLDVSFWLLNADGSYRAALPEPRSYALSPIVHEPGAIRIGYPVTGRNFHLLREHSDNNTDVEIAVWTNGRDEGLRALLLADDADDIAEDAVWTFTGSFSEVRLEEAVIEPRTEVVEPPTGEVPTEDVAAFRIYSATAGTIMRTLMLEAQARGTLVDIDFSSFSNTLDSNGVAWSKVITLKIAPGTNYLEVAQSLVSFELCEFRMIGRELRLFEFGTVGVDRTVGPLAEQVVLRRGRDMRDAPRKRDVRRAATDLLVAGDQGLYRRVFDATARARRGRQVEQYRSAGSIADEGTLLAYGAVEMARVANGKLSVTHGLDFTDARTPVPLRDFNPGDWVWSDTGRAGGPERLQVMQVTIEGGSNGARSTGSVGLNDLIASREAQLARRVKGIEGGSTLTGTSQARPVPEGPDTTIPAAPEGLSASSSAYPAGDGRTEAQITAAWEPVTTNDDTTAIDDLAGYTVRYRYEPGQDLPTAWTIAGDPVSGESLSFSGLIVDVDVEVQVQAYDESGNRSQWSAGFLLTTSKDADPPPVGSAPAVYSFVGLLAIPWDGLGALGEPMPADFLRAQVHVSTTADFEATDATYVDELRGAGTIPYRPPGAPYGATFYARIVTEDRSGNVADAGPAGSAVLEQVADGDIAEVNIGKLVAGIMSAIMTISGIIRTAAAGARVEIDTAGLRCIGADERVLFEFSIPNSLLTLVGRLIAGAGIGVGSTIVISPGAGGSPPFISFYANATTRRTSIVSESTGRPDGTSASGFEILTANSSNQYDGFTLQAWSTNLWQGFRNTLGQWIGARLILQGLGGAWLYGRSDAFVNVSADGDIFLTPTSGRDITGTGEVTTFRGPLVGGRRGAIYTNGPGDNAFVGIEGDGNSAGFQYFVVSGAGIANIRTPGHCQVVSNVGDTYRAIRASAFEINSDAAVKDAFDALPAPALDALRGAPPARWRYRGDPANTGLRIGPLADDLPSWLVLPPDERVVDDGQEDGEVLPPNGRRVDLVSMVGVLWAAVRELDAELDDVRRSRGAPAPARATVAELLDRLRRNPLGEQP